MFYYKDKDCNKERKKVLFVGRFVYTKGIIELLDVEKMLLEEGYNIDCVYVGDGPLRPIIEEKIMKSGYASCFSLKGWVQSTSKQLFDIYRDCDIMCLPSYSEGLGLVLLEAMSNGVAVIASGVEGIKDIVEDEKNGLLVRAGSRSDLKSALKQFLTDERLRLYCIENGYRTAAENTFEKQRGYLAKRILKAIS
jgi:glycosyltransferase involved in cell wall biosynthesis